MKKYEIKYINAKNETEIIKLDESFGIELYLQWRKSQGKDRVVDNIIKVMLPSDFDEAMNILMSGYIYGDILYYPLATTTNYMKHEEMADKCANKVGICEYLFVAEEDKEFISVFMEVISLGKIKEKLNKEEMFINKDIVSRISLAFSSTNKFNYYWKNKIVILPETTYQYTREYITLDKEELSKGTIELNEPEPITGEHTAFDGFGLASPSLCDNISEKYGHKIDYFGLRMYPLAVKGLCVRFDFVKYIEDIYKEDILDEHGNKLFWKDAHGDYFTKDMFGENVNVSRADFILNETQVKWANWWKEKGLKELYKTIEQEEFKPYKNLYNSIWIARVNKKELEQYTRMNYQLLNATNITPFEMAQLTKYDKETFQSMIAEDKKDRNIDRIKIFMGDMANGDDEGLRASTKVHELMQLNERFYTTKFVKEQVLRMILKKSRELTGGKFLCKGNYKTQACDPIAYCNYLMNRTLGNNGLKVHEFYVSNEFGKRVIMRNPLAAFFEPQKIELVENELLIKYLGENYSSEIIFFNQVDDTAKMESGSDFDLDESFVIDNEIIYNSIMSTIPFWNIDDGKKGDKMLFTYENMYKSILVSAGNTIGKIAIITSKINSYCQDIGYMKEGRVFTLAYLKKLFIKAKEDKFIEDYKDQYEKLDKYSEYYESAKKDLEEARANGITGKKLSKLFDSRNTWRNAKERVNKEIHKVIQIRFLNSLDKKIKKGELKDLRTLNEEELKKYINDRFEENKKYIYYALYLNQKAIDGVKTAEIVKKEEIELLEKCLIYYVKNEEGNIELDEEGKPIVLYDPLEKYPYFLQFTKDYAKKRNNKLDRCPLSLNAMWLQEELLKPLESIESTSDNNKIISDTLKPSEDVEKVDNLLNTILECKQLYNEASSFSSFSWYKDKINAKWNEVDREIITKLESFKGKDFIEAKAGILKNNIKPSNRFIIKYFYDVLKYYLDLEENKVYQYSKDDNGDIDFFYNQYSKNETIINRNQDLHKESVEDIREKTGLDNKIRFGGYTGLTITDELYVINGKLYRVVDNTELGYLFPDSLKKLADGQVVKIASFEITGKKKNSVTLFLDTQIEIN